MVEDCKIQFLVIGIQWPPETFLLRLLDGLSEAGISVTIASATKPGADWISPDRNWIWAPDWDIPVWKRIAYLTGMLTEFIFMSTTRKLFLINCIRKSNHRLLRLKFFYKFYPLSRQEWDVVYFPWIMAASSYLSFLKLTSAKVLISCRGSQINIAPYNPARSSSVQEFKEVFQAASTVHCVSTDIMREAMQYGLDQASAWVIRPAVDPEFFCLTNSPFKNSVFKVITTGSLNWVKGLEYALLTIRELVDLGIETEFHVVGEGPEKARVLYTIQDLNLEGHVTLHGKLHPDQVRDLLQQSDVFLLSSLSEGISNAVLEAMSCGLPVVTTDCGGMAEAITDGVEGYIVPVRDPSAAAEALVRLAKNIPLREDMGRAARQRVIRDFTLSQQVAAFRKMVSYMLEAEP